MPNLTETFDQVKRSSEIRSSECFPPPHTPQKNYVIGKLNFLRKGTILFL
jgi:hypothetical protein